MMGRFRHFRVLVGFRIPISGGGELQDFLLQYLVLVLSRPIKIKQLPWTSRTSIGLPIDFHLDFHGNRAPAIFKKKMEKFLCHLCFLLVPLYQPPRTKKNFSEAPHRCMGCDFSLDALVSKFREDTNRLGSGGRPTRDHLGARSEVEAKYQSQATDGDRATLNPLHALAFQRRRSDPGLDIPETLDKKSDTDHIEELVRQASVRSI